MKQLYRCVIFFRKVCAVLCCFCCSYLYAQEIPAHTGQQVEDITAASEDVETEDDHWLQQTEHYRKHPLNLNTAGEEELLGLQLLTPQQVHNLLSYRRLLGPLLHVYELQAVPGWHPDLVRKLLPYITVAQPLAFSKTIGNRLLGGEHILLLRLSQTLEKQRGYYDTTATGNFYPGSPQRLLFRYKYVFKNELQYGITAEKDPGEQFFTGKQKTGFDFYSAHLFARNIGKIKALALGDFTVNMGQGLVQWQSLAFRKSADALAIKWYSPVLRPYNSAGEYNFFRGAGITLAVGKAVEATVFGSFRKYDARVETDSISENPGSVSSLLTAGYHRTISENAGRNSLHASGLGGNIRFTKKNVHIGANIMYTEFNHLLKKSNEPYNRFAISGSKWYNISIDYSATWQNLHFFGETATGKNGGIATVNGLMMGLDTRLDAAVLVRSIPANYQSVNGSAFTEGTRPNNEQGIYTGITFRPVAGIRVDAYADYWYFPFLRYRVNAPSQGSGYLVQLLAKPNKQAELYIRYRTETKEQNNLAGEWPVQPVNAFPQQNLRVQVSYKIIPSVVLHQRTEMVWVNRGASNGFMVYAECVYQPQLKPFSANMRVQYFETGDYNSRVYAYEHDVLYSYSVPALYGKGFRYYTNINCDINRKLTLWFRWAQTNYREQEAIGSGLDEIQGNRKSEFRVQVRWVF